MKFAIKMGLLTGVVATTFMLLACWTIESFWDRGELPLGEVISRIVCETAFLPIRLLAVFGLECFGWSAIVVSMVSWLMLGFVFGYLAAKLTGRVRAHA